MHHIEIQKTTPHTPFEKITQDVKYLVESASYQNNILEKIMKTQEEFDTKLDELNSVLSTSLDAISSQLATLHTAAQAASASQSAKADMQLEYDKTQAMIDKLKGVTIPPSDPTPVAVEPPVDVPVVPTQDAPTAPTTEITETKGE